MAGNHLEDLVAEWYQFQGYFVRRNVLVGARSRGGYECELDVVAFHPAQGRLVQIEPSLDSNRWEKRERRYAKKFESGRRHIPELFPGMNLPPSIEQIALFVYGGPRSRTSLAGGKIVFIREFMSELLGVISTRRVASGAIPEEYPLLRTLQFASQYWPLEGSTREVSSASRRQPALPPEVPIPLSGAAALLKLKHDDRTRSWVQLRKGILDLLGRAIRHSTDNVRRTSLSFARKASRVSGLTYEQILDWMDQRQLGTPGT